MPRSAGELQGAPVEALVGGAGVAIIIGTQSVHLVTITMAGRREFVFRTAVPGAVPAAIAVVRARHPDHEIQFILKDDPDWDVYGQFRPWGRGIGSRPASDREAALEQSGTQRLAVKQCRVSRPAAGVKRSRGSNAPAWKHCARVAGEYFHATARCACPRQPSAAGLQHAVMTRAAHAHAGANPCAWEGGFRY